MPLINRTHIVLCSLKQRYKNFIKQFSIETAAVMDIHAVFQPFASAAAGFPVAADTAGFFLTVFPLIQEKRFAV